MIKASYTDRFERFIEIFFEDETPTILSNYTDRVAGDGGVMEQNFCLYSLFDLNPYADRVAADGGIMEGSTCLDDILNMYPYNHSFKYLSGNPLNVSLLGERFKSIIPTKVDISLMIIDDYDRAAVDSMIGNTFNVLILQDGVEYFKGTTDAVFTKTQYGAYPYTATISCSDGLARLTKYQPLMIDFPDAYNRYSLLNLLSKVLPKEIDGIAKYQYLNYAKTNENTAGYSIETIFIPPLAFMKDSEYENDWKIIDAILTTLNMKLFSLNGEWWLVSKDINSQEFVTYRKYDIVNSQYVGNFNKERDVRYIDCNAYTGGNVDINHTSREIRIKQEFKERANILTSFTNDQGNFYQGSDGIYLEGDSNGFLSPARFTGDLYAGVVNNNDGMAKMQAYGSGGWTYLYLPSDTVFGTEASVDFKFSIFPAQDNLQPIWDGEVMILLPIPTIYYSIELHFLSGSTEKILYLRKDTGDYYWKDEGEWFPTKIDAGDVSISAVPPAVPSSHYYKVVFRKDVMNQYDTMKYFYLYNVQLSVGNTYLKTVKNSRTTTIYNDSKSKYLTEKTLTWGFEIDTDSTVIENESAYHLTPIANNYGLDIDSFTKDNITHSAVDWLGIFLARETQVPLNTLSFNYTGIASPLTVFIGDNGDAYDTTSFVYSNDTYQMVVDEYKYIEDNLSIGDYNKDFNIDFNKFNS